VFCFSLSKSRFFEKFQVWTRFFKITWQKNTLLEIYLFIWDTSEVRFVRWAERFGGSAVLMAKTSVFWKRKLEWITFLC
jgi:hypothetical protein